MLMQYLLNDCSNTRWKHRVCETAPCLKFRNLAPLLNNCQMWMSWSAIVNLCSFAGFGESFGGWSWDFRSDLVLLALVSIASATCTKISSTRSTNSAKFVIQNNFTTYKNKKFLNNSFQYFKIFVISLLLFLISSLDHRSLSAFTGFYEYKMADDLQSNLESYNLQLQQVICLFLTFN